MSLGPVADGSSRTYFSNLSASAQPFTLNRTISTAATLPATSLNEEHYPQHHRSSSNWIHNQVSASIPDLISGFTEEICSLSVNVPPLNPHSSLSGSIQWYAGDSFAPNTIRNSVNAPFAHVDYSDSLRASVIESDSHYSLCPKVSVHETRNLATTSHNSGVQLCGRGYFSEGFVGTECIKQLEGHGSCVLTNESDLWDCQPYSNYSSPENLSVEHPFSWQEITSVSDSSGAYANRNSSSITYVSNGRIPRSPSFQRPIKASTSDHASRSSELFQQTFFQKKSFTPVVIRPPSSVTYSPALDSGPSCSSNVISTDLFCKSGSSLEVLENNTNDLNNKNGPLLKATVLPHYSESGSFKICSSDFYSTHMDMAPDLSSVNTHLRVSVPDREPDGINFPSTAYVSDSSLKCFDSCSSSVTVDSPCWKGTSSSNLSPFHVSSMEENQFSIPLENGVLSSSTFPEEPLIYEPLSLNKRPVISGAEDSQTQILRNQVITENPCLKGYPLGLRKTEALDNHSETNSDFRTRDIYRVPEGSAVSCENMLLTGPIPLENSTRSNGPFDSRKAEMHSIERVLSSLKISGDRPVHRSKKLSHKLQTHMIIGTLKTLSELLLFQYSGGYDMMENDFEAIQHIIDNLSLFKKENEFSIMQNICVLRQKGSRIFDSSDECWDTAMKEIIGRRNVEKDETGPDAMMYKYLWLEAEAALSYMGYKDRLAPLKQGSSSRSE